MVTPTPREGYALAGFISEAIAMNKVALVGMGMADARAQDVTTSGIAPKLVSAPSTSVEGRCQP